VTAAIIIALIALAGSVISTVATVFGSPALKNRNDAKTSLQAYREPILAASYELQARLHNILCNQFIEMYIVDDSLDRRESAIQSTLYVFGQYFAWREIIRREVQYLRFSRDQTTREISRLFRDIGEAFLADGYGSQLMIWRVEQRGIGERMIEVTNGRIACVGYASFLELAPSMTEWLGPIERNLEVLDDGGRSRLRDIQHLLLDLVTRLDEGQTRYPFKMEKA
jgi:hypothetical protein